MEIWIKIDVEDIGTPISLPQETLKKCLTSDNIYIMLCVIHNNVPCYTYSMRLKNAKIYDDGYDCVIEDYELTEIELDKKVQNDFFMSQAYFMTRTERTRVFLPVTYH